MVSEAREYFPPEEALRSSGVIIEFPRPVTEEEKQRIKEDNLSFIQAFSMEQDPEAIEKALRDMNDNPTKRLIDLYSSPIKTGWHLSTTIELQPEFTHQETRYIP